MGFLDKIGGAFDRLINVNAESLTGDETIIAKMVTEWLTSNKRQAMLDGERYFDGRHDILSKQRTVIGAGGDLETVHNLPNNKIVDNQYRKMVIQKTNYLLGKPLTIQTDEDAWLDILKSTLGKRFTRTLKVIGEDSLNCGIGYLLAMYDEQGKLIFKRLRPWEIIPGWKDAEHTELSYFIRVYDVTEYVGTDEKLITKVEVYDKDGIRYYELTKGGKLVPDDEIYKPYFTIEDKAFNWAKIPLIPFKYNGKEIPLIRMVKSLQDALNTIESNFQNSMEEDVRNTIMVLVNYEGENLGNFRKNLATYGAVKVGAYDGVQGDVKTLQIEVNSENYKAILEILKKAIIENAMGYDAKDDRMAGNPNQMNIQSMYSDIDLDANSMEIEYQASIEDLMWFIAIDAFNKGLGDYDGEPVEVIFNRDMMINESEVIDNINKSAGILSEETLISQHPWVSDPQRELERFLAENACGLVDIGESASQT